MLRKISLALFTTALIASSVVPTYAGPNETAFLKKLANTWSGKGKLQGAESGPINCKLVFTAGSKNTRFQGRCTVPDMGQQAFSGSISYNDKAGRYESRSSSGTVPGVRKGDKLVFRSSSRSAGNTSTSTMTISPSSLVVDLAIKDKKGNKSTARINFSR
jgi:hypothetical protein